MTRTIAITGATGFVGQTMIEVATAGNANRIRALTRRPQPANPLVEWIEGALDTPDALRRLCDGTDAVVHIAGAVNVPTRADFAAANVAGTQAVVDAATTAGVRRFVHVSSLAAREPSLSNYGWSKAEAEAVVKASSLDWTIVRPPAVYGPRDHDMLELFRMAQRGIMLLPPPGRVSVIHVADLTRLLLALASGSDGQHQLYEADDGTPGGLSHAGLAQAIGHSLGRTHVTTLSAPRWLLGLAARGDRLVRGTSARLTPDRASYLAHPDWVSDPAKAPPAALWQPRYTPDTGLADTAAWYRCNGLLPLPR
jgi:nucleoside-diphosphate-sugar epimerase